jgi:hypothetical protein
VTPPTALPAPASRHAVGLLRFPDRRTDWVIVTVATLVTPTTVAEVTERLAALHRHVPIVGARLRGETWHPGTPPEVAVVDGEPLDADGFDRAFDLTAEAPLRLLLGADGTRLGVLGHHAAFDGLALAAVLDALTGGAMPEPVDSPPPGDAGSRLPLLARLLRPAQRVTPTIGVWPTDAYATATVDLAGRGVTGRLAAACVAAARAHNLRHGERLDRVGITVAVGGPVGVGNVASYRRLDLPGTGDIAAAVTTAMADPAEPGEQVSAPKLLMAALAPVVERFSDTILVSNLGRLDLPGVRRLDFFPVARGRSAVCFASASILGGETSLTLRARDLSPGEARRLLDDAAART